MEFPAYEEYKPSLVKWLGNIPSSWTISRLKFMSTVFNGLDYKHIEVEDNDDGYPVYGSGGAFKKASEYLYDGESILYGRKGTIDKPLYVNGKFWTVDTMFYSQITESFHGRFLYYSALTIQYSYLATQTALPSITQTDLSNYLLCCPKLYEQEKIAAFLDYKTQQIDQLIAKKKALIEKLQEQRIAIITQAVTKGLDPNVPMKDSGVEWLGEVPEHWHLEKLKFFVAINGGGTPNTSIKEYWNGDIPWISPKDMKTNEIYETQDYITELGLQDSAASLSEVNTLAIVVRSGILKHTIPVAIIRKKAAINQDIKALLVNEQKIHYRYLFFCIYGLQKELLPVWTKQGCTVESIEVEDMMNTFFLLPTLAEQKEISLFLEFEIKKIEKLISANEHLIEKLTEYRTALITAAVTGKIDVRNIEIPSP